MAATSSVGKVLGVAESVSSGAVSRLSVEFSSLGVMGVSMNFVRLLRSQSDRL